MIMVVIKNCTKVNNEYYPTKFTQLLISLHPVSNTHVCDLVWVWG